MAYGCFISRDDQPGAGRTEEVLGAARPLWQAIVASIEAHTRSRPAWRFYGRNYGWALAFKKGGRALAALFPDQGRLTVLVVLDAAQAERALADPAVGEATKELVASLPRFREGCWAFLGVATTAEAAEAGRLIDLRAARPDAAR